MALELTEGKLVLCKVKKIEKTNIFLDIEDMAEGSMVLSEVAAGRIRNLREYIVPNKKIVCKILNISNGHIELSLRRVTAKERQEVLERHKKERNLLSMLKTIVKNPEEILKKIKNDYDTLTFLDEVKETPEIMNKFFSDDQIKRINNILKDKIEKEKEVKKVFKLSSISPTGIIEIKEILYIPEVKINYLGSSKFSILVKAKDFKEANKKMILVLDQIKQKAKQKHAVFEVGEK